MAKKDDPVDVAGQVKALTESWNPPPSDAGMSYVVGEVPDEGDGRATKAAVNPLASPTGDNRVQYEDDGDDPDTKKARKKAKKAAKKAAAAGASVEDYADEEKWTFGALKDEIDARNANLPEDSRISKGGGRDDLVARLVEDDKSNADGD